MDLSRRDAIVLAQWAHQVTNAIFVLLAKENCNWNRLPFPFPFLWIFQCNNVTSKLLANSFRSLLPSTHCLLNTFKIYRAMKLLLKSYYLLPKSTG